MGAAGAGSGIGLFYLIVLPMIFFYMSAFLYGCHIAYKGAKNKSSLWLYIGMLQIYFGIIVFVLTKIIAYAYRLDLGGIADTFITIGFFAILMGMIITPVSFILYVKHNNKVLISTDI